MWKVVVLAATLVACANQSFAWVNLEATCSGGQAQVQLRIGNTYGPEFVGLVVTRYQLGTCEPSVIVTASPVALLPGNQVVNLNVPAPGANLFYLFEAKLVDAGGAVHVIPDDMIEGILQVPRDLASDGPAVVARGTLSWSGAPGSNVLITPCQDGCWGDPTMPVFVAPLHSIPNSFLVYSFIQYGLVADIVGVPIEPDGTLQPEGSYIVSSLVVAPDGSCGTVAEQRQSWGSMKVLFR